MDDRKTDCVRRAIAALTYDQVIMDDMDVTGRVPVLQKSISRCLDDVERGLGARGQTRLHAIGCSIDEALLCLEEYLMESK